MCIYIFFLNKSLILHFFLLTMAYVLQSLDGRAIRVDEAGKGGRSRGGFQSGTRGGRFGGSRGRGGRGYSRGESWCSVLW